MGQYYTVVNLDKRESISPYVHNSGSKALEQAYAPMGIIATLYHLLLETADIKGNYRGAWASDRLAVVGDYAQLDDLPPEFEADKIYTYASLGDREVGDLPPDTDLTKIYANIDKKIKVDTELADLDAAAAGTVWGLYNYDRQEYVLPQPLGDSPSPHAQIQTHELGGIKNALHALLTIGSGRGGGDYAPDNVVGSWAAESVVVRPITPDLVTNAQDITPLVQNSLEQSLQVMYLPTTNNGIKKINLDDLPEVAYLCTKINPDTGEPECYLVAEDKRTIPAAKARFLITQQLTANGGNINAINASKVFEFASLVDGSLELDKSIGI